MDATAFAVHQDIPPEWRAGTEFIMIPKRNIPDKPRKCQPIPAEFTYYADTSAQVGAVGAYNRIVGVSDELLKNVAACAAALENAEGKRREIAGNAELIHGICDSQIGSEQNISVFVKAIDESMIHFDTYERISVDFKSPMFTVLSPDFPATVKRIQVGLDFFRHNASYRESRIMVFRYQSLQKRAIELIRTHLDQSFASAVVMSRRGDKYSKFRISASSSKRLFALAESSDNFVDFLDVYRRARVDVMKSVIEEIADGLTAFSTRCGSLFDLMNKEKELSAAFFSYATNDKYEQCFDILVDSLMEMFCTKIAGHICLESNYSTLCEVVKPSNIEVPDGVVAAVIICNRLQRLLETARRRLESRIGLMCQSIAMDGETVTLIETLKQVLPTERSNACISGLVFAYLEVVRDAASEMDQSSLSRSVFLVSKYMTVQSSIAECPGYIGRSEKKTWSLFERSTPKIDVRKEISSNIHICLQEISSFVTQFLMHPVLNMRARGKCGVQQVSVAVEGVDAIIQSCYERDVCQVMRTFLGEDEYNIVLGVIKEQMMLALADCASLEMADDAFRLLEALKTRIRDLS